MLTEELPRYLLGKKKKKDRMLIGTDAGVRWRAANREEEEGGRG